MDTLDPGGVLAEHNYMIGMPFLAAVKVGGQREERGRAFTFNL